MTPEDQLLKLYERWGVLSDTEGEAIRDGDWSKVAETQRGKEALQDQIMARTGVLVQTTGDFAVQALQERIHGVLHKLIQQEKRNQASLSEQRQTADDQAADCRSAGRNLRQLRKAYSHSRSSNWHSYS